MMKTTLAKLILAFLLLLSSREATARGSHTLKLEGVPASQVNLVKKRFPHVFEREVTLAEVDEVVKALMATQNFANIEVVEKTGPGGDPVLALTASLVRRIHSLDVSGNTIYGNDEIFRILRLQKGQTFERKVLVEAVDVLQEEYGNAGYLNTRIDIEFRTPSENEVDVIVKIDEGDPCRVIGVNFETPNQDLVERVSRMAKSMKGDLFTKETVENFQKKVNEYLSKNRFLTAKLSNPGFVFNPARTQARLTYVIENANRYEFFFEGNEKISQATLIKSMELENLAGITTSPATYLAERIQRLYLNRGYANAQVEYKDDTSEQFHRTRITFKINEGSRVKIKKIEIGGNISRPEKVYAKFIQENSSELVADGYYNRKDFETGYRNLIVDLQNQGFLRAKIQSVRTEYTKDKKAVVIAVNVDEGPLTQVRQIKFEGVNAFSKLQLAELMKVKSNSPLSLKDLEESLLKLREHYYSHGYLEMRILNDKEGQGMVTYNESHTQANIEIQIQEGPKIVVGSIAVDGNSFTKEHVILRELAFAPGDTLTPEKLEESTYRLQKLGLFSQVEISTLEQNTNLSERTVRVAVAEREPGLVTSGVGILYERRDVVFRGYLGVSYRNIGGTGRAISARIEPRYSTDPRISFIENKITLGYLEPYMFGGRNRGRVNLTREQRFLEIDPDEGAIMQEENSIDLLLERDLLRHLKLTYTVWGFSNQRRFGRFSRNDIETQNIARIGPLFELDYRDNPLNPTKGHYSLLNLEYADPVLGSSGRSRSDQHTIRFVKTNAGTTHYWRLGGSPRLIWQNGVRAGYISNTSDKPNSGVPATEMYYLGGRSTIRGFDSTELERIPNNRQLGTAKWTDFRLTSDSYYYLLKTELRFPIYGEFGGALFYDGGAVYVSEVRSRIEDPYRDSIGFGFRYNTPVGAVSLDLGYKLDRKTYADGVKESPIAVHFFIGTF